MTSDSVGRVDEMTARLHMRDWPLWRGPRGLCVLSISLYSFFFSRQRMGTEDWLVMGVGHGMQQSAGDAKLARHQRYDALSARAVGATVACLRVCPVLLVWFTVERQKL